MRALGVTQKWLSIIVQFADSKRMKNIHLLLTFVYRTTSVIVAVVSLAMMIMLLITMIGLKMVASGFLQNQNLKTGV